MNIFRLPIRCAACCIITLFFARPAFPLQVATEEMIKTSITSTQADWKEWAHFSYDERDIDEKDGVRTSKTYKVCMIDGSPYSRLFRVEGKPLSPEEQAQEGEKLREAIAKRANESPEERAHRVAAYQKDNDRMFALLSEMAEAFDFKEVGQEQMNGHEVYVLEATPRPGYEPKSRETKLLTGMTGKLWIDKDTHKWVRVEAVAIKPVWMGWFIAKVLPGTSFSLDQSPAMNSLWLPEHFSVDIKAKILWWQKSYAHSETYSDYHLISATSP
jgi:hypothetical protein